MMRRVLLIDAGNTRLKWGVLEDGEIHETGHLMQADIAERGVASITTRMPADVDGVFVSSVAGQRFATRLAGVLSSHCACEVRFARTEASAGGIRNGYEDVRSMGVDRWVAMIGAWSEFRSALLVVDAGTAVTIDAVDAKGQHLGGQILPGFRLMAGALGSATSDIPVFELIGGSVPRGLEMFGRTTESNVAEGAGNAIAGAIERAITVLRSNAYDPIVILTGGDASAILEALPDTPVHRPDLVLAGLASLLENTR